MRIVLLYLLIAGLGVYAWRNWFRALCGLIVLAALLEHPDMPRNVMGIQGLNPWNGLLVSVVAAWLAARRREGLRWDMPAIVSALLAIYVAVIVAGVARVIVVPGDGPRYPIQHLITEDLANTLKWLIPGLLLFDGCRSRSRATMALVCIMVLYGLLAVQVMRRIPRGAGSSERARASFQRRVGYSACDMAVILSGAFWGFAAVLPLARRHWQKAVVLGALPVTALAISRTGGRAGITGWACVGLMMAGLRWRKRGLVAVIVAGLGACALADTAVPLPAGVRRLLRDVNPQDADWRGEYYELTSGRMLIWPAVVERIGASPYLGYGRRAMFRTGLSEQLMNDLGESFPHPHNAYLESLLDNGLIGFLPIAALYGCLAWRSGLLFARAKDPLAAATGGVAFSALFAQLIGSMGAQHLYPTEGTLGMWLALCLMLRVSGLNHVRSGDPGRMTHAPAMRALPWGSAAMSERAVSCRTEGNPPDRASVGAGGSVHT